jgi:hypothetical protein
MTKKIWVVRGTTGEYSDRSEWPVCAYKDEQKAKDHAEMATKRAKEIEATRKNRYPRCEGLNEFDPNMSIDYTGTEYFIEEMELKG